MVNKYMPILKWRMGEYQALSRLNFDKSLICPLFVIPPIEYDFEKKKLSKSADEHVSDKPNKIQKKWGLSRASFVLHDSLYEEFMGNGLSVYEFFLNEFEEKGLNIWPVIFPRLSDHNVGLSIKYALKRELGVVIRFDFESLLENDLNDYILNFSNKYKIPYSNIELLIDFGSDTDFEPVDVTLEIIEGVINEFDNSDSLKAIYIAGHSLKMNLLKANTTAIQSRSEWKFFKYLYGNSLESIPNIGFSDYAVETPEFNSMDMRLTNPSARLIYSNGDNWIIVKGSSFRNNPKQMHKICHDFIYKTNHYYHKNYSKGDEKIYDCAHKNTSCGNLTVWKEAATSHHITLVVEQIGQLP